MGEVQSNLFVTGNSSGLGWGLTEAYLARGRRVYGCSRRGCDLKGELRDVRCDLSDLDAIGSALGQLLADAERLELVILNAGILGEIRELSSTSLEEIRRVMDVNVWSNKVIMDWLHGWGRPVEQVVMISSGASVLGNKGWGAYALSKAALNMLAKLYAHEFPNTHIAAIAPGLIDTAMMDYLCGEVDAGAFPAMQRIRQARGTEVMPAPRPAAERLAEAIPSLRDYASGSYVDIRQILAPEEYEQLLRAQEVLPRR